MAKIKTVGIKELKDKASMIVQQVINSGQPVSITKNGRTVAQLVSVGGDTFSKLYQLGILLDRPQSSWRKLKLNKIGLDATLAIKGITEEREA